MRKGIVIISIISIITLVTPLVFTGCAGQKFSQESDRQYAYSFEHPSGWSYTLVSALQLSLTPNGDLKQEIFLNNDGTMLDFEVRIVNDWTQYDQSKTYFNIPAEELRYTNYTADFPTIDGMSAQEYVFTTIGPPIPYDGIDFHENARGTMIWFSDAKYEYVFLYLSPTTQLFDSHHDVYAKAISSFLAN